MPVATHVEIGDRFGDLVVVGEPFSKWQTRHVRCRCSCGQERDVRTAQLKPGAAIPCVCRFIPERHRRVEDVAESTSAKVPTRPRTCGCGSTVVEAPLRASGELVLLEPRELFPRGPCPRCEGRGVAGDDEGGRASRTCPTCRGGRIIGVSLDAGALFALDAAGRARAVAPAERRTGEALHFRHACALKATQRAAA